MFFVGLVNAWNVSIGFFRIIFGIPAMAIGVVVMAIALFWQGIGLARQPYPSAQRILAGLAAPTMLTASVLIALPSSWAGGWLGDLTRLLVNFPHYERIIAQARKNPKPAWFANDGGVIYSVDVGPPVRVAFNPGGFLDNWSGTIFDPTGDVMLADGFDARTGKFVAPDRITKLFNGDLVGCRHLWGDYYTCSFT